MDRYQKKQLIIIVICVLGSIASFAYIWSTGSFSLQPTQAAERQKTATNTPSEQVVTVALGQTVRVESLQLVVTVQQMEVIPCPPADANSNIAVPTCSMQQARVILGVQSALTEQQMPTGALPPEQIVFTSVPSEVRGRQYLFRLLGVQQNQAHLVIQSL